MASGVTKTLMFFFAFIYSNSAISDLNLEKIIYVGNQLPIADCRRLVASLDSDLFDFPDDAVSAAIKLPKEVSCSDLLAAWQLHDGSKHTHTHLVRRLKQIGYENLSNWLSQSVFNRSPEEENEIAATETYETETFTFEAETESWTEFDVGGATILPKLDTDDTDLFAEILAALAGISGLVYLITKLCKKFKRQPNEELPLRSSKY